MRRRRNRDVLAEAQRALEQDDVGTATELLYRAFMRTRSARDRQRLQLELIGCCLLGGDEFLPFGAELLDGLLGQDIAPSDRPLASAFQAELEAVYGADRELVFGLLGSPGSEPCARTAFHGAAALLLVEAPDEALELLGSTPPAAVPEYLRWRFASLEGVAWEQLGDHARAAEAIRRAISLAPAGEARERERLALVECLLETGDSSTAATVLGQTDATRLSLPEDETYRLWLCARVEERLGNPGLAIGYYRQARRALTDSSGLPDGAPVDRFTLLFGEAQLQADAGDWPEAVRLYRAALAEAGEGRSAITRHELAVALIDSGDTEEAAAHLQDLAAAEGYEWRAEALAELADLAFSEGDNPEAERLAHEALRIREIPSAYICLGCVALDYFNFPDAVDWFDRAAGVSTPGDAAWVGAQQLLADTYARMGPETAERLLLHASAALRFTDRRNDWYLPLRAHEQYALRALAGRQRRTVN